jgi:hypothetical protein
VSGLSRQIVRSHAHTPPFQIDAKFRLAGERKRDRLEFEAAQYAQFKG